MTGIGCILITRSWKVSSTVGKIRSLSVDLQSIVSYHTCAKRIRLKGAKSWDALKEILSQHEDDIRDNLDPLPEGYVPFEVIYPAGDDMDSLSCFEDQIFIINAARNNNAQLKEETKANHKGLYD